MLKVIAHFKISIYTRYGIVEGYSRVQFPHNNGDDFMTVFSQTSGIETLNVKLSDVERFISTPVYREIGKVNAALR